jgi:amino acid transporter/nucleotide-binding universal stress UspA family protein
MARTSEVRLSREMRLMDITMIGVGAMIGAGIFVLTGIAAGVAGPGLLLVFLLNGFVTLFAAAAYAELGSSFHDAGGGYLWVKTGLKDPHGFLSGWMSWFAHAVACSLYALGFGAYFHLVLPMIGVPDFAMPLLPMEKWLAVGVVALFAYINYRGASEAGGAGNIVTVGKILVLAVFVGFGIWITVHRPNWQATFTDDFLPNGFGKVFMAMGLTFIAFEGYEIIAQCSEEVRAPERNVPRAIFLSLLIVVPIYLLVAFASLGAAQSDTMPGWQYLGQLKETALVEVASHFFRGGGIMILIGGLLSTMSALNATIYSSSRVSFAMGRDRNLPAWFGKVHPERKTPHWAILASAVLVAFMAVALPIEAVASAADIMFLLLFIQVLVVLIKLRKKRPDLKRGFKVPWVPFIPIVGIALQLFLAVYLFFYSPMAWLSAAVWIGIGVAMFYGYAQKRDRAYAQLVQVREAADRRDYRILACIGPGERSESILNAAAAVARHYKGELIALTVVEVDDRELLATGFDRVGKAGERLERALATLRDDGVPVKSLVKISHRISYGITETAREEKCNLIVMGRSRRVGVFGRFAATMLDRVVRSAPVQVMVVTAERWPEQIKNILFPYEVGPHSDLTADVVGAFAATSGAVAQPVHFVPRDAPPEWVAQLSEKLTTALGTHYPGSQLRVVPAGDLVTAMLHESRKADLIVMGGTEAGLLEHLLGFALPLELADRTAKAVVTVYEMEAEPRRWLRD